MVRPVNHAQRSIRKEQILEAARGHLRENGLESFSLRAVARRVGMAPNSLYNYFPRLEDLITELLVDAFTGLAATLTSVSAQSSAGPAGWAERFVELASAYRTWAVDNPTDYDLIFGRPIPGYVAPADRTADLPARSFQAGLDILLGAWRAGALDLPQRYRGSGVAAEARPLTDEEMAEAIRRTMVIAWSRMHGLVLLDIHGHLVHSVDDPAELFTQAMRCLAVEIGLTG